MACERRERVIINVSGRRFQTWRTTLRKHPDTLLGSDQMLTRFYDQKKEEYFLDRDPQVFRHILSYYQVGKLHISHADCMELFYEELKFYGISNNTVHECCWGDCYDMSLKMLRYTKDKSEERCESWGSTRGNRFRRVREVINGFFEMRHNSLAEKLFQYVLGVFILLSVFCAIMATLRCDSNSRTWEQCYQVFQTFDIIFTCVFSLEYALRFLSTPCFGNFFKDKFNLLDLAAISPFYVDIAKRYFVKGDVDVATEIWDMLRVFRGIRVLKLARHSWFIRKLGRRLKKALTDLGFLYFAFVLANIFFASCLYNLEILQGQETYQSIPDAMWYTVVTMMTLGYVCS